MRSKKSVLLKQEFFTCRTSVLRWSLLRHTRNEDVNCISLRSYSCWDLDKLAAFEHRVFYSREDCLVHNKLKSRWVKSSKCPFLSFEYCVFSLINARNDKLKFRIFPFGCGPAIFEICNFFRCQQLKSL